MAVLFLLPTAQVSVRRYWTALCAYPSDPSLRPIAKASHWDLVDPPLTQSLLPSISLLGKPPHSSIMSMATGKNLHSIPKKVSEGALCSETTAQ